ncbi:MULTISPECIES: hypothetical protein [unclassified Aurantimonas]|uniref:hypothetical protein n=1 Tax=unclassified Aurantimonas TaxID=2638230 RepID=UPI002E18C1AA|nr:MULTISPECIES: hypothetical protein [unclassified Aurantimonas]MEC5293858.1 hypothetical protein [Aurantimonas sp. C2-3-R2]MEC5414916.1 hypothetical protein [Aurantimonas sp. C2-4-R8]
MGEDDPRPLPCVTRGQYGLGSATDAPLSHKRYQVARAGNGYMNETMTVLLILAGGLLVGMSRSLLKL